MILIPSIITRNEFADSSVGQQLRELIEDLGLIPRDHIAAHSCLQPISKTSDASLQNHGAYTQMQKQYLYT